MTGIVVRGEQTATGHWNHSTDPAPSSALPIFAHVIYHMKYKLVRKRWIAAHSLALTGPA